MSVMNSSTSLCPCCRHEEMLQPSPVYTLCSCCGHRWRLPSETVYSAGYYEALVARNDPQAPWFKRKISDRVALLCRLLEESGALRILEIGCAEGELGGAIKARCAVVYDGVELSRDSELAEQVLDRVFKTPASEVDALFYGLIVSFHVLEHIAEPEQELTCWSRLLDENGQLLIEVPNQSGHPLLANDHNPEHLHQFTPASLAILLSRSGFACAGLSVGHYESPVYPDSIRVVARPQLPATRQRSLLLQRFRERFSGPFLVYGIGGDFFNYLAPVAEELEIQALLDSSPNKWGQRIGSRIVDSYDPAEHGALPILVCSIRFGASIRQHLLALGIAEDRIIGLESIYEHA
ncbi:MAG TPA: class I SAM-dependent methyltransferase [Pseudomonas sp.]|nr:class I SAM-dependent methyltransferase [Pseudomonas sp.]